MKKKVLILRGGPSGEYEVSLKTGRSVFDTLNEASQVNDNFSITFTQFITNGVERKMSFKKCTLSNSNFIESSELGDEVTGNWVFNCNNKV